MSLFSNFTLHLHQGTDCTDCGGVDQYIDWNSVSPNADDDYVDDACVNTCTYARDGVCDDPRSEGYCALGTDCQDCGPVGHSNFSSTTDDMWWDDGTVVPFLVLVMRMLWPLLFTLPAITLYHITSQPPPLSTHPYTLHQHRQ